MGESVEPEAKSIKKSYMNSASFQEHLKKKENKKTVEKDDEKMELDDNQLKKFMSSLNSIASGKPSTLDEYSSENNKESNSGSNNNQFIS